MSDTSVDRAIQKALKRASTISAGRCPDDNRLAAYLESRCGTSERAFLEEHFAACGKCQQVLALSLSEPENSAGQVPARRFLPLRFAIPLSTLAAAVIILAIVPVWRKRVTPPPQTAELHSVSNAPAARVAQAPAAEIVAPKVPAEAPSVARHRAETAGSAAKRQGPAAPVMSDKLAKDRADRADAPIVPGAQREAPARVAAAKSESAGNKPLPDQRAAMDRLMTQNGPIGSQQNPQMSVQNRTMIAARRLASAEVMNSDAGASGVVVPQSVIARFKTVDPALLSTLSARKAGEKVFYLWSDYWIDRECTDHADAAVVEAMPASKEYQEIVARFPDIREIAAANPVLLYWTGKTYVIRW